MSGWWDFVAAKNGVNRVTHTLLTVNGTGIPDPFGPGFDSDCGRALADSYEWTWQPVGYPAAVVPMGPSVRAGIEEVVRLLSLPKYQGTFGLSGYSQGALVTNLVWRDEVLNPKGRLHHRKDDVIAIVNFGDPMRCPGIANGNLYAGQPLPKKLDGQVTGGIAGPQCLRPEETPDFLLSFANDGDLYAAAPVGERPWEKQAAVGEYETLIFNFIQETNLKNTLEIAKALLEAIFIPLTHLIPLVEAIINGLTFAAQGMNAPHWTYNSDPAIRYLTERGRQIPARAE